MSAEANIFFDDNKFEASGRFLAGSFSSCHVLVDENTMQHCYPLIASMLPVHHIIQIPSGELHKNIDTCQLIWAKLTAENADRKGLFINLGGGVIGDMGGFAASCYKRGIPFIQMPTTLLAMVDASVGGKTGIDFMGFKNQLGLFNEPEAVFICPVFLKTLPQRELTSGFAEVIKHYLIADRDAFEHISHSLSNIQQFNWVELVKKNIVIKTDIVLQDPHEKGIRKALNFGHTIGHAIESWFLPDTGKRLLHGEAVAAGMASESYISYKKGLLTEAELQLILKVILHYFKLPLITEDAISGILRLVKQDKKNEHNATQFTLLQGIGNYCINNNVEEELIKESLNYTNPLLK